LIAHLIDRGAGGIGLTGGMQEIMAAVGKD
jgi:hypothetical protein